MHESCSDQGIYRNLQICLVDVCCFLADDEGSYISEAF